MPASTENPSCCEAFCAPCETTIGPTAEEPLVATGSNGGICSTFLKKEHNQQANKLAEESAYAICGLKNGDRVTLARMLLTFICCESPIKFCISIPSCLADSAWFAKQSTSLYCSFFAAGCKQEITLEQFHAHSTTCNEDVLTTYEQGGIQGVLTGPASARMI